MKRENNNKKQFEFKFDKTQTENDLKEYILGLDFKVHNWSKETRERKVIKDEELSPFEKPYYNETMFFFKCKRCGFETKEIVDYRCKYRHSNIRKPTKRKDCNMPYPGYTRKQLFEKLKIRLREHLEEKRLLPVIMLPQIKFAIMCNFELERKYSIYERLVDAQKTDKKIKEKEILNKFYEMNEMIKRIEMKRKKQLFIDKYGKTYLFTGEEINDFTDYKYSNWY